MNSDTTSLVPSPSSPTSVSPASVYPLVVTDRDLAADRCADDGQTSCRLSTDFVWRGREACNASFICADLSGNVCGDFGIITATGKNKVSVCHESVAYGSVLQPGDVYSIRLWFSTVYKASERAAECYFWCAASTGSGGANRPPAPPNTVEVSILNTLVLIHTLNSQHFFR